MMKQKRKADLNYQEGINEVLVCKYCTFETENIDELDSHILSHEETCEDLEEDCEDIVVLVDPITNKKRIQHELDELYTCSSCSYTTKRKYDLPKHLLTHSTPATTTIYKCFQCPYETKRKNDMPKHMLAHCTDVEMFKCPECPYQTKRKSDLPKHLLCHKPSESVPLYKCDFCDYVTKRKGDLPKHILNHTDGSNLKLFDCSECDYRTKRKNDLHKHMLVHCDRHVAGVFKCLKCTYATDKVNKFSKHALSDCRDCENAINIEHLMLQNILTSVDSSSIQQLLTESQESEDELEGEDDEEENADEALHSTQYNREDEQVIATDSNNVTGVFKINLGEYCDNVKAVEVDREPEKLKTIEASQE